MFNVTRKIENDLNCCAWVAIGTVAAAIGAGVAAAGIGVQIYSAANPPKTPTQASGALNKNQVALTKLQAKLSDAQATGKDTTKIASTIAKTQSSIAFLNSWIAQHGDTLAPKTPDGNFAAITDPIGSKTNSGAPQIAAPKNWILIGGIIGVVLAIGFLVYSLVTNKKS